MKWKKMSLHFNAFVIIPHNHLTKRELYHYQIFKVFLHIYLWTNTQCDISQHVHFIFTWSSKNWARSCFVDSVMMFPVTVLILLFIYVLIKTYFYWWAIIGFNDSCLQIKCQSRKVALKYFLFRVFFLILILVLSFSLSYLWNVLFAKVCLWYKKHADFLNDPWKYMYL